MGGNEVYETERPGAVAQAVIPARWEEEASRSLEIKRLRPAWLSWQNPVSIKTTKIRWCTPVIPATQVSETGESLEPRRQRLQ